MGIFDKFRKRDNLTATDSSQQRISSLLEEKAKKLGLNMLDEKTFLQMIKQEENNEQ